MDAVALHFPTFLTLARGLIAGAHRARALTPTLVAAAPRVVLVALVLALVQAPWTWGTNGCCPQPTPGIELLGEALEGLRPDLALLPDTDLETAGRVLQARVALGAWGLALLGLAVACLPLRRLHPHRWGGVLAVAGGLLTALLVVEVPRLILFSGHRWAAVVASLLPLAGLSAGGVLILLERRRLARWWLRAVGLAPLVPIVIYHATYAWRLLRYFWGGYLVWTLAATLVWIAAGRLTRAPAQSSQA